MIEDFNVETLEQILSQYKIHYMDIDVLGRIMYNERRILINPYWNQDGKTLLHESIHHYFDIEKGIDVSEQEVEYFTEILYENPCIKKYVDNYKVK